MQQNLLMVSPWRLRTIIPLYLSIAILIISFGCGSGGENGGYRQPIAEAGPDRTVELGFEVFLDGSSSYDPEGSSLAYEWSFISCPAISELIDCPELINPESSSPSFLPTRMGDYTIQLIVDDGTHQSEAATITIRSTTSPTDPDFLSEEWKYGIYGTSIGQANLVNYDLDGDGDLEIIASASTGGFEANTYFYVLENTESDNYKQIFSSRYYIVTINEIVVSDTDYDGIAEIYVALSSGVLLIYDGMTFEEIGQLTFDSPSIGMAVADTNLDGDMEIIVCNKEKLYAYSAVNYQKLWETDQAWGDRIKIGNVDNDPAPEIIIGSTQSDKHSTDPSAGFVVDGITKSVEFELAEGFGLSFGLNDIDSDGRLELIIAYAYSKIAIYDAESHNLKGEIATSNDHTSIKVGDTNGDGISEILIGYKLERHEVEAFDGLTLNSLWTIRCSNSGVTDIEIADVDSDGDLELLYGVGSWDTGPDRLRIFDAKTQTLEWESPHLVGPLSPLDIGDIDSDGINEIVMASTARDVARGGVVHIFDATSNDLLELITEIPEDSRFSSDPIQSVRIGDIDDDGQNEILIASGLYRGYIYVFNGQNYTFEKKTERFNGIFTKMAIGDIDNDGETEIVAGFSETGSYVNIVILDGATLQEEWRIEDIDPSIVGVFDIKLLDMDNDGGLEIIFSVDSASLYIVDGTSQQLEWNGASPSYAFDLYDINDDGTYEIVIGKDYGKIEIYDSITYNLLDTYYTPLYTSYGPGSLGCLKIVDIDDDGQLEMFIFGDGIFAVYDVSTKRLKWHSDYLIEIDSVYTTERSFNQMVIKDIDNDGRVEVVFGGQIALYQFQN